MIYWSHSHGLPAAQIPGEAFVHLQLTSAQAPFLGQQPPEQVPSSVCARAVKAVFVTKIVAAPMRTNVVEATLIHFITETPDSRGEVKKMLLGMF